MINAEREPLSKIDTLLYGNTAYKQIFNKAMPLAAQGRWWDLPHTILAIEDMNKVLSGERASGVLAELSPFDCLRLKQALVPAVILHDIGWSGVGEAKNTDWGSPENRRRHMEIGASLADSILQDVGYGYTLSREIVNIVAHHDDAYLGGEPQTLIEKLHRDIDASFVFSNLSFWKDFAVSGQEDPAQFLEAQLNTPSLVPNRYTRSAQQITDARIAARRAEIKRADVDPKLRFIMLQEDASILQHQVLKLVS